MINEDKPLEEEEFRLGCCWPRCESTSVTDSIYCDIHDEMAEGLRFFWEEDSK